MGSGESNPDGFTHNSVQILRPGVAIIGFRDIWEKQNKSLDNSTMKSEIPILDIIESLPESATAKNNLVFGNFNVSTGAKHQQQHQAV
jgi:hypothetical protein